MFALSDDEESHEGGEPELKLRLHEPAQRWCQAREEFQPPHCLVAQSCPGNAAGGGLPSLAVRTITGLMNLLLALHSVDRPAPPLCVRSVHAYLSSFLCLPARRTAPLPCARVVTWMGVAKQCQLRCGSLQRVCQGCRSGSVGTRPGTLRICALSFIPSHVHYLSAWLCFVVPAPAVYTDAWHGLQGSVHEGRGRKLTGTSAMRLRMSVLRQTGFLGPPEEGSKAP